MTFTYLFYGATGFAMLTFVTRFFCSSSQERVMRSCLWYVAVVLGFGLALHLAQTAKDGLIIIREPIYLFAVGSVTVAVFNISRMWSSAVSSAAGGSSYTYGTRSKRKSRKRPGTSEELDVPAPEASGEPVVDSNVVEVFVPGRRRA